MPDISIRYMNIGLELCSIAICMILMLYQMFHLDTYKAQKYWFIVLLVCNMTMMAGDITDWLFNGVTTAAARIGARYGMCLFYGISGVLLLGLIGYFIELMDLRTDGARRIWRISLLLAAVQVGISIASLWNGAYFYYTEENVYMRGWLYPLSQVIPILMFGMGVTLILMGRKSVSRSTTFFLMSHIAMPMIGQTLQCLFYGIAYINVLTTFSLLFVNINVQHEQELLMKKKDKELAELQIDIMLNQIQPHFLYNALSAIRQLCDTDTEQAKESILDFSRFLRANMRSLTAREPIAFEQELEHVRSYLKLEQQRFGKRLEVVYDIQSSDFLLPTLTLQPIVENAVRHGIFRREDGGTVTICTEEGDGGNRIIISDDGVGFPEQDSGPKDQRHVGLENVSRRLKSQCNGTLIVKSGKKGTEVTIWIPKKEI